MAFFLITWRIKYLDDQIYALQRRLKIDNTTQIIDNFMV